MIMFIPGFYVYTTVIFSNPSISKIINALFKLVIISLCVHQLAVTLFSRLTLAVWIVHDADLLFLNDRANIITNTILEDGGII